MSDALDSGSLESRGERAFPVKQPDALQNLLAFLDSRLDHLWMRLARTRHVLTEVQQRLGGDVALLGQIGEAVTSLRDSERLVADIERQIAAVRHDTKTSS